MKNATEIRKALNERKDRSAWARGVTGYALELLDRFDDLTIYATKNGENAPTLDNNTLLNGARDWSAYSWGGSALAYDCDIAARLCSPSELKRTRNGDRRPNAREEWRENRREASRDPYYCYSWEFALPYAEQKRAEQRERGKILAFCRGYLRENYGFDEYKHVGTFNNGEAVYRLAA